MGSPFCVDFTATLRYEPCTQFINVSQRTLHIYFIDGCRKYPKNNEFCTKKFLNQGFLHGISSFCPFSENNSFLHGKISCFCIFFKNVSSPHQACGVLLPPAPWSGSGCHGFPVLRRPRRSSGYHPGIRSLLPSIHNDSKVTDRSPVPA